ncbi:hypothetical protein ELJ63_30600, partial [Klebsiella pneumoniae]|nr:hypothetical protein [Klebsiella pneumoniae]
MDERVDRVATVSGITTLNETLELSRSPTTVRVGQLERPEELASLFEVGAASVDFVNQILNANKPMFTEVLFDDSIVLDWDSLALDLGEASFVEQLLDRL